MSTNRNSTVVYARNANPRFVFAKAGRKNDIATAYVGAESENSSDAAELAVREIVERFGRALETVAD